MSEVNGNGRAFKITGAAGETVQIEPGGYYFNTKARCRRMMRDASLSSHERQVYACLELATMGFQQELAVEMESGKKRPLTPGDIGRKTGLTKQHVRRALAGLQEKGLSLRQSDDGGPLRNGHVLIYSWATPRQPSTSEDRSGGGSQRAATFSVLPDSWSALKALAKRRKVTLSPELVADPQMLEEGARIARDYQNAEKVAVEFLGRVSALRSTERTNKEERYERKPEIEEPSPPTPSPANADEGSDEKLPATNSLKVHSREFEVLDRWPDFQSVTRTTQMPMTAAEIPRCRKLFARLTPVEQREAYRGVLERLDSGEYDPSGSRRQFIPTVESYLYKKLWLRSLRPRREKGPDTSWLDDYVASRKAKGASID